MRKKMTKTDIAIRLLAILSAVFLLLSVFTIATYAYPVTPSGYYSYMTTPSYNDIENIVSMVEAQMEFLNTFTAPPDTYSFIGLVLVCEPLVADNPYSLRAIFQVGGDTAFIDQVSEEWGRVRNSGYTSDIPFSSTITYTTRPIVFDKTTGDIQISRQPFAKTTKSSYTMLIPQSGGFSVLVYLAPGKAITTGINDTFTGWSDTTALPLTIDTAIRRWENARDALNGLGGGGFTQEDLDNAAQEGYDYGWEVGNAAGFTNGYTEGFQIGNQEGYDDGYSAGYDIGVIDGSPTVLDVPGIITAIPSGARAIINGALDFEIFGINVAGTLLAILVVAIVAYIVKKVK